MRGILGEVIADVAFGPLARFAATPAWALTQEAPAIVSALIDVLGDDYEILGELARHRSAIIEPGAVLKGPCLIGPDSFVASSALLRGGCWLERDCIVGPGCELKTCFLFKGSKAAHLNFIGDSVIGAGVNIEAGAILANYRNERMDKRIVIRGDFGAIETGVDKFGALVGDNSRIGANAVIAPGAILPPRTIVRRLELVDQG